MATSAASSTSRRALVTWRGPLATGSGSVTGSSSGTFTDLPVSWPSRIETPDGRTSPEELLAAAHASCFSMALSSRLAKAGAPPEQLEVGATVTLADADGGRRVTSSVLDVRLTGGGVDTETLEQLAADAKEKCPISQALKGNVEMSVEVVPV